MNHEGHEELKGHEGHEVQQSSLLIVMSPRIAKAVQGGPGRPFSRVGRR